MLNKKRNRLGKIRNKSFLILLYEILNDEAYREIIHWNSKGNGIIISNVHQFTEIVLPKYYKHNKYSSFVRQLNIYGFYKPKGITRNGEGFIHDKFTINMTKDEINEISQQNKKRNLSLNDFPEIIKKEIIDIETQSSSNNETNLLKNLLDIELENKKMLIELKNEVKYLAKQNETNKEILKNGIYGYNFLFKKIFTDKINNKIYDITKIDKFKGIKKLFKVDNLNDFNNNKETNIDFIEEKPISFQITHEKNFREIFNNIANNKVLDLEENSNRRELKHDMHYINLYSSGSSLFNDSQNVKLQ